MKHQGIKSIARNTTSLFGARLVSIGLRTIYVILVARIIGPELYGLLVFGQSWYLAFLPIAVMGLSAIIGREIGRNRANAPDIVARTFAIRVFASMAAAVACATFGWFLFTDSTIRSLIIILAIALAGRSMSLWVNDVYAAFEVTRYTLRQEILFRVIEVSLSIGVLFSGGGILALAVVHGASWWGQAIYSLFFMHRRIVPLRPRLSISGSRPVLYAALPLLISGLAHSWQVQGPIVLFQATVSINDLTGQLALAMQILFIAMALPEALSITALPILSRSAQRGDGKDVIFLSGLSRTAFFLGTTVSLIAMALGPWLVPLLFGVKFSLAGDLLGLVLWLLVPYSLQLMLGSVFISRGHYYAASICQVLGAVVLTLALPPLAGTWGTLGAIAATGLGFWVSALSLAAFAATSGWFDMGTAMLRPLVSIVPAMAAYSLLEPHSPWIAFAISLPVLFLGFLVFKVVTTGELRRLKGKISTQVFSHL